MTKITLRSYNREIEAITDQGKIDLAIAHCLHILKFFPKHVDTYRLLGKAYLENQRLGDAADIFQRVLSAVPDDFVAHIGMSIIREDEGNLDAAIWHMQRAYDVQSSNITIQDELRRLYNKRDGIEPAKIRLSRAALARMYARGDLINEAITELRSALQEEPDRADLLVLLARMYYTNNQRVKSIQTCSQVLNKLPFCLDANIIINQALIDTNRTEEAVPYLDKAKELDPYAAYISEHAPTLNLVPDGAVTLLKLEESEISATEEQPAWVSTLGVSMPETPDEEDDIDWLLEETQAAPAEPEIEDFEDEAAFESSLAASEAFGGAINEEASVDDLTTVSDAPTEDDGEDDEIPDWLQDAGWEPRDPSKPEEPVEFDLDDFPADTLIPDADQDPVPAEIPDWLRAMAPPEMAEDTLPAQPISEEALSEFSDDPAQAGIEIPDWLKDLDADGEGTIAAETPAAPTAEMPDWLSEVVDDTGPQTVEEEFETGAALPDWLKEMDADDDAVPTADETEITESIEGAGAVPDWLAGMALDEADAPEADAPEADAPEADDAEWEGEAAEEIEEDGVPDWLTGIAEDEDEATFVEAEAVEETEIIEEDVDVPDWLAGMALEDEAPEAVLEAVAEEEVDVPDWLAAMAEDKDETAEEAAAAEASVVPDWLQDFDEEPDAAVEMETEAAAQDVEAVESAAESEDLEAAAGDLEEDIPDWLKEMAKQADESSATSDRTGVTLWLRRDEDEEAAQEEQEAAEETEEVFDPFATIQSTRPAALEETEEEEEEEGEEEKPVADEVPTWLQGFDDELLTEAAEPDDIAEEESVEALDLPDMDDADAALRWLESLAAKQGAKEEELLTSPEERTDTPPAWVQTMAAEAAAEAAAAAEADSTPEPEETVIAEDASLDWEDIEKDVEALPEAESATAEEDLDWLQDLSMSEQEDETFIAQPEETVQESPGWPLTQQPETEAAAPDSDESDDALPAWMQEMDTTEEDEEETAAVPAAPHAEDDTYVWEQEQKETPAEGEEKTERRWWKRETGPLDEKKLPVQPETAPEPPEEAPAVEKASPPKAPAPAISEALAAAREALADGNVAESITHYKALIKKKAHLDEVIEDLNKAVQHSHPINIDIWAALGDAHAKNDNIQKALDAYTKAEELIR